MRYYSITIGLLLAITTTLRSQDNIIAENIYSHEIKNGKTSTVKHIIEQNTYNEAGQKVLHIQYYDSVPDIKTFTLFFYQDSLLISKETFTMEKIPLNIVRYSYDEQGLKKEKRIYESAGDKLQLNNIITFSYRNGILFKKIVLNKNGKRISKSTFAYSAGQQTENIRYKKGIKEDNPVSVTIASVYDSNKIVSVTDIKVYPDKTTQQTTIEYTYDENTGKLTGESWFNDVHDPVKIIEYKWKSNGTLASKGTQNSEGNYTEFLSYKRENYVVNLGDQPMYDLDISVKKKP